VKILDFGLARAAGDDARITQSGTIVGTPAFMAPEQAGGSMVDHHCDLFSLGAVLYRMCTGGMPFKGDGTLAVLSSLATATPRPPREINADLPPELSHLIMRLLTKDPQDRPASAQEVVMTLQAIEEASRFALAESHAATASTVEGDEPSERRDPASAKRKRVLLAAVAVGAAALLVAAAVFFLQTPNGTIRVTVKDPKIEVTLGKGTLIVRGEGEKEIAITPGEKRLHIERDGFAFDTKQFALGKGDKLRFSVEWLDGKVVVHKDGKFFEDFGAAPAPPTGDPARAALEWLLNKRGQKRCQEPFLRPFLRENGEKGS
jgi:hypothetical protein